MVGPEDIRTPAGLEFGPELHAARELDALTDRLLKIWSAERGYKADVDRIVGLEIARGTTSFKSVLHLAEGGFGRQGLMINRSMFEGMAVAHWVAANPEEALDRFHRSGDYSLHKNRERLLEFDPDPPGEVPGELTGDLLARAIADFGPHNERLWTGHRSIWTLVEEIEDQWEEPGRTTLRMFLRTYQQQNNQELHATVLALINYTVSSQSLRGGVRGTTLRVGAGPEEIDHALMGAFFIHSNLLGLLVSHVGLGDLAAADLQRVTEQNQYAFALVTEDDAQGVGRNDPCPCGSGVKFKHCHIDRLRSSPTLPDGAESA